METQVVHSLVSLFKTQTCQKIETQYLLFLNIMYTLPNLIRVQLPSRWVVTLDMNLFLAGNPQILNIPLLTFDSVKDTCKKLDSSALSKREQY